MWGCISTEASYQLNFNTTFSTTRSDVLVHLAQWQYWWWFWFSFVWCLYYFIFLRVFRYRVLKMRPKIMSSYRPHGKWGDFLAAIIPGLWCLNILTNSNFILRLIEWQSESSLFTIRVRARQWYWIYKYDSKVFTDVLSVPKNVGSNKWIFSFFGDMKIADDYVHILQLRRNSKWIKNYWSSASAKLVDSKNFLEFAQNEQINCQKTLLNSNFLINSGVHPNVNFDLNFGDVNNLLFKTTFLYYKKPAIVLNSKNFFDIDLKLNTFFLLNSNKSDLVSNIFYDSHNDRLFLRYFNNFTETSRFVKRPQGLKLPFRLVKNILFEDATAPFFTYMIGNGISKLEEKTPSNSLFLVLKQKKYTRKDNIMPFVKNEEYFGTTIKFTGRTILLNNSIFHEYLSDSNVAYRLLKKNKKRMETIPTTLAKRLLRVKRTLVLPAHINITIITNSFDIVHSWFIPGLGVKLDCVPGRSTHHTFYIDNVGFYFGQCAEICGRYHHHMPIRVCALPFEHFLVWWNIFGISRLTFINKKNYERQLVAISKYTW